MARAGDNEKRLKEALETFGIVLGDKVFFKERLSEEASATVSVDAQIASGNRRLLVEIDSYNMAKVVAGQYTVINSILLREHAPTEQVFVVVHCYKGYRPERTRQLLTYIDKTVFKGKGLPFVACTYEAFVALCHEAGGADALVKAVFDQCREVV